MSVIDSADLWFPGCQSPVGWPVGYHRGKIGFRGTGADPLRYVVWVRPRPPSVEQAPRQALHLVECRNGSNP